MSWLRADRPRSEVAATVSALVGATVVAFGYVIVVGEQHGTVAVDRSSFDLPTMPLGVIVAPIAWWLIGAVFGTLAWIILGERRLPERPRLRLQPAHRAVPAVLACLFCNFVLVAMLRPSGWSSGFNENLTEFSWTASPMSMVVALTIYAVAWLGIYGAGRFMLGDGPDEEPMAAADPDPVWEARRRDAADAMRGRWGEP
jgi:H+/Cl- antiporter ClcA